MHANDSEEDRQRGC